MLDDEKVKGLSLVDLYTDRGTPRLIGNIAIKSSICTHPIVGYENHGGRTYLGSGITPLGVVEYGHGNDGKSGYEGCLYKHVLGTYIHGPLFPKTLVLPIFFCVLPARDVAFAKHSSRSMTQ